jgi:hypothetical protein
MTRPEDTGTPCPNPLCAGILEDELDATEGYCSSCGYSDRIMPPEDLSEDREDQ